MRCLSSCVQDTHTRMHSRYPTPGPPMLLGCSARLVHLRGGVQRSARGSAARAGSRQGRRRRGAGDTSASGSGVTATDGARPSAAMEAIHGAHVHDRFPDALMMWACAHLALVRVDLYSGSATAGPPDRPQALAPVRKRMRTAGASPQTDAPGIDQDSGPGILV